MCRKCQAYNSCAKRVYIKKRTRRHCGEPNTLKKKKKRGNVANLKHQKIKIKKYFLKSHDELAEK